MFSSGGRGGGRTLRMFADLCAEMLTRQHEGQRHLPVCPVGLWVGNHAGHGAKCSGRCARIRLLLQEAAATLGMDVTVWLNAKPPRRAAVDSEKSPS